MTELCVVHLARHANGWEPFERFMQSYEQHPAGIDHELVVALKGHTGPEVVTEYQERIATCGGSVLPLPDVGFDIGSYWAAARLLAAGSFCFLNSFSVIQDGDWLAKLAAHQDPAVAIVGASGSWESHRTGWGADMREGLLLPPWREASEPFPKRRLSLRDRGWLLREWLRIRPAFPPFPNPHIRTNAFLMRRDLLLSVDVGDLAVKEDALRFESGRASLTRQVLDRGFSVLVVGRDGVAYSPEEWPISRTFRSGDQSNLLVSDNRTDQWMEAEPSVRERQSGAAWGKLRAGAPGR